MEQFLGKIKSNARLSATNETCNFYNVPFLAYSGMYNMLGNQASMGGMPAVSQSQYFLTSALQQAAAVQTMQNLQKQKAGQEAANNARFDKLANSTNKK